jgi:predicted ATPase
MAGGRFELLVKPPNSNVKASIVDVGFGVSQFIPIIIADLQLGKDSTLMISQPEIHLHPSIQAKFANYIQKKIQEGKRYIIETHSEYFLNRIRYLIVNGKLDTKDIKVQYFWKNRTFAINEIEFTKKGEIKNAPQDFFDTYQIDILNIALES